MQEGQKKSASVRRCLQTQEGFLLFLSSEKSPASHKEATFSYKCCTRGRMREGESERTAPSNADSLSLLFFLNVEPRCQTR